jgi:stage III sporulation protein AB
MTLKMTKLLGSMLIISASIILGIKRIKNDTQRLTDMEAIVQMLKRLEGELSSYSTPLPQLFDNLIFHCTGVARAFLEILSSNLSYLGEVEFSTIWSMSANETLKQLRKDELSEFVNLGNSLGRYGLDLQVKALDLCITYFENAIAEMRAKLPEMKKLYIGISGTCGILLVILLV